MRGGRKGSMQLSIEAIIILVIAMVLLGLGISFIRTFFAQGEETLMQPFDAIQFGCSPDSQSPITISPSEPEVKSGGQIRPKICVYANKPAELGNEVQLSITECRGIEAAGGENTLVPELIAVKQPISRTEIGGFNTILSAKQGGQDLPVGTYICTLSADTLSGENLGTKQVTISVT